MANAMERIDAVVPTTTRSDHRAVAPELILVQNFLEQVKERVPN